MNNCGTMKNVGGEEKRDEQGRRMPVRIHELLGGVSKSTGKVKNVDGSIIEKQRSQPMRIKDLLASMSSCKKPNSSARRMTTLPNVTSNARRQLYNETLDHSSPDKTFSSNINLQTSGKKTAGLNGCAERQIKTMPAHQLGLSRSEGKNMKINAGERHQPERVKGLMESWEKSQTVKHQVRKSTIGVGANNVRRKLYHNVPSPVVVQKITRKSLAPHKMQSQILKTTTVQRKSLKPEPKKSQSRKSCLLPPNSIRDKHVNRQQNETIKEESPASLLNDVASISIIENSEIVEKEENSLERSIISEKSSKISKNRLSSGNHLRDENLRKNDEKSEPENNAVISRPTVIKTAMSERKIHAKSESASPRSSESKKSSFTMSRPVLQDLNRSSLMTQQRLDAMTSSIEDLLGDSRFGRDESFRTSNLPFNSFLDDVATTNKNLASVDRQTLAWMHANLSITIRSTEENLFSMKQMLRTLEELRDKNSYNDEMEMKNCDEKIANETETKNHDKEIEKIVDKNTVDENSARLVPTIIMQDENSVSATTNDLTNSKNIKESKKNIFEEERNDNENKENIIMNEKVEVVGRRRSARLAALEVAKSPKNLEDSFSIIERELNIFHEKSANPSPRIVTPKERRKVDPRCRRSMREYMALKSVMNCLQTPDVKGLPTPKGEKDTPSHRLANKRTLSRQLLSELDDLYAESPQ